MSSYTIISQSATEPILLSEAKDYLRIDGTQDDDMVGIMVQAARQMVENKTWVSVIPATYHMTFDKDEVQEIMRINKYPIRSIEAIYYKDADGVTQTLSVQDYEVDLLSNPVRIRIKTMPNIGDYLNAFWIEFEAGFEFPYQIPKPIIQAMKLIMGHLNENRQDVVVGSSIAKMPMGSEYLIEPYIQPAYYL